MTRSKRSQAPSGGDLFSTCIIVGICSMLVLTPWFFGGVSRWVHCVLLGICAVLLIAETIRTYLQSRTGIAVGVPTTTWLLLGGIALGMFQLVPLNEDGASKFANGSMRWHEDARLENDATSSVQKVTRSLYPPSTRENVALLLLVTGVFWLSSRSVTSDRHIVWLLTALAVCGLAISLFGLIQRFTWNGQIYWRVPLSMGGNPFGPFVNRNNGGGFLNMCLAGGIGLYVWLGGRSESDQQRRDEFGASHLWVMATLVLIGGAIVASASRGSILSLLVAAAMVFALMVARRGQRSQALGILVAGVIAFSLVVWLGEFAEVQNRFDELSNQEIQTRTRSLNWSEASQSLPDFWGLGSGLSTYRFVCLPFQTRLNTMLHFYAENQYFQALTDGGVVALLLMLLAIGTVGWGIVRLFRTGDRVSVALAATGLFALGSQIVGGAFDFGLYLPANGMLLAAICGTVMGRVANGNAEGRMAKLTAIAVHPVTAMGLSLALLVGAGFGAVEMWRAANVQEIVDLAMRGEIEEIRDDAELIEHVNAANAAIRHRADDADGHRALADLWMQRYRVAYFRASRQNEPWMDEEDTWFASSLMATGRSLLDTAPDKRNELLAEIQASQASQALLKPAFIHAQAAQKACPWQPQNYLTLATLAPYVGVQDSAVYLERARKFAGGDPTLWYRIGLLEQIAGRDDQALKSWKRASELSSRYESAILSEFAGEMTVELAEDLVPPDLARRLRAVHQLKIAHPAVAKGLATSTIASFESEDITTSPAKNGAMAGLFAELERHDEAIKRWKAAIAATGYGEAPPGWHAGLVEAFLALGETKLATEAVENGLRQFPDDGKLAQLLEKCRKTP